MKKENTFKKILVCTTYLVLAIVCIFGVFFLIYKSSNRENDNIVRAQDSGTYLRSVNPKFLVDFVNDEYIRFETVSSYSNPFEGTKGNIWQKIQYMLGIRQQRKGIEISLIDVSYDTELRNILEERDINISEFNINRSFELISSGRVIGEEGEEPVSKDTVISRNIYRGVDLEYQIIEGKGLKEEIVLREIPQYVTECSSGECTLPVNRFLFKLDLDEGLEIKRSIEGNDQYPSGALYIVDGEGNYYAHFLPEYAVDAVGNKTSNVVSNISVSDKGGYIFEVILDSEWLLSEERVFPIRIDPSIVHDSEISFNEGKYDRVSTNEAVMLSLNEGYKSGSYTSGILDLGSNSRLNGISWDGYSQATGDGEISYSVVGLIHQEDFNDLISSKTKWGSGALQLDTLTDTHTVPITPNETDYFTLELWSNSRYIQNEQYILKSNLINLKVKEGLYILEDSGGIEYPTELPAKYNDWEYIAVIMDMQGSSISLYVNELEYEVEVIYTDTLLNTLTFTQSIGYIDSVRVYDRLVPRNELLGNSQYSNIYLQYSLSDDGLTWSDWYTKNKYLPESVVGEGNISLTSEVEDMSIFDILTFKYFTDTEQEITLGINNFVNGVDEQDITRLEEIEGIIELTEDIKYMDVLFTPDEVQNGCILALEGLEIYTLTSGEVGIYLNDENLLTEDMYIPNTTNILSISLTPTNTDIYLNGNVLQSSTIHTLTPQTYTVGDGCTTSLSTPFVGDIKGVRLSTQEKSSIDILEYSNILNRTYILKPVFKAVLQSDTQIVDINDTTFSIAEIDSSQLISNLYVGDTVVISEDEEFVQGIVSSLDSDTGLVTVDGWQEGSTVPELGFSTLASIVKWEEEHIFVNTFLERNTPINTLTLASDIVGNIKDITLFSTQDMGDEVLFENTNSRYLKYKFIYITSRQGMSSYLSSVNIDFESGGPEMDQILRHGQWFNEGSKQGFWWVEQQ
jgi:hypothetical protein